MKVSTDGVTLSFAEVAALVHGLIPKINPKERLPDLIFSPALSILCNGVFGEMKTWCEGKQWVNGNGTAVEKSDAGLQTLLGNVAGIAASLHSNADMKAWYDLYANHLSGFVGIWDYCVRAGLVFTHVEHAYDLKYDTDVFSEVLDGEWPLIIGDFAMQLLENAPLEDAAMDTIVREIFEAYLEAGK